MKKVSLLVWILVMITFAGSAEAYTKEEVVKRGRLLCGVSTGTPGFASVNTEGKWTGFDVDICRAVAVATLGSPTKVEYIPLAEGEAFSALLTGEVDILSNHSTWTFARDSALAVHFSGVSYYDGQGFMVPKKLEAKRLLDLKKVKVCGPVGAASEQNLIDYFERNRIEFKIVPYDTLELAVKGFEKEACDLLSMQQSQLHGLRLGLVAPENAMVLPEVITKEPLGPVVRQGDDVWLGIVRWSLFVMINAEELGITSRSAAEQRASNILDVRRLFGLEGAVGKSLGLKDDWAYQVIRQVGNYGEVFERNFGPKSLLKIDRGLNNLWNKGGLQYAPPFR
ncbi:MAG: amino acid ABC transporter substrate-binding protein [Proteobacteria bacterium]|nr:amino acid ABC transporter substrate-binding protein [Pseudomonadota bacterium]